MWKVWSRKVRTSQKVLELQWSFTLFQLVLELSLSRAVVVAARALLLVLRDRNPIRGLHTRARHSALQLQLPVIILLAGRFSYSCTILTSQLEFLANILSIYCRYQYFSLVRRKTGYSCQHLHEPQLDSFSLCRADLVYIWIMVTREGWFQKCSVGKGQRQVWNSDLFVSPMLVWKRKEKVTGVWVPEELFYLTVSLLKESSILLYLLFYDIWRLWENRVQE